MKAFAMFVAGFCTAAALTFWIGGSNAGAVLAAVGAAINLAIGLRRAR